LLNVVLLSEAHCVLPFHGFRQKRREDDFRRTVGNYKMTVDTLRQEKQALLELQQSGEGEKNDLVASSQKALSRAAHLVSEAAILRRREAEAVATQIECISFKHISHRLESILPHEAISSEFAAIKGEILASKVVCKVSQTLSGIFASLRKNIRPPPSDTTMQSPDMFMVSGERVDWHLSDDLRQEIQAIMHQMNFALAISEVSSELIRFIAAGQWPDLLTIDVSMELGTIVGHSVPELDHAIGALLKTLKEEGSLTAELSDLGSLQLTIQRAIETLRNEITSSDKALLDFEWKPPGWVVFRDMTLIKAACLGMAAAFSVLADSNSATDIVSLTALHNMIDQCSSYASNADLQLVNLDVTDANLVEPLAAICNDLLSQTRKLIVSFGELFTSGGNLKECYETAKSILQIFGNLTQELRAKNLHPSERETYHPFSAEAEDPWRDISNLARSVRSMDGDSEDVNYLVRAKSIELRLGSAVDNEPKLELAIAKVASLEKVSIFLFLMKCPCCPNIASFFSRCRLGQRRLQSKMLGCQS
jgi:dynactin 1